MISQISKDQKHKFQPEHASNTTTITTSNTVIKNEKDLTECSTRESKEKKKQQLSELTCWILGAWKK